MDDRYYTALFPQQACVLGRKLKPFSLAHRAALCAIDSPFSGESDQDIATMADLQIAVDICTKKNVFDLKIQPSRIKNLLKWIPNYFSRECKKFMLYQNEYGTFPKYMSEETENDDFAPHWTLNIVSGLMHLGSVPQHEAWAMPEGRAIWLYSALARHNGAKVKIISTSFETWLEKAEREAIEAFEKEELEKNGE
jgi:hypothetical protein